MAEPDTYYAPAERAGKETIERENSLVSQNNMITDLFAAMPDVAAVLNMQRQIVYANEALLEIISEKERDSILGMRPGEAVSCIHCNENEAGCGTSESCKYCGAVNAILESQEKKEKVRKECRIVSFVEDEEYSYDFEVTAVPVTIRGEEYTYLFMKDISSEKRRQALERIFFHDIINTAGGIQGYTGFLSEEDDPDTIRKYIRVVDRLSHDLVDEIQAQRALTLAENNELTVKAGETDAKEMIENVDDTISHHAVAQDKRIKMEKVGGEHKLITDEMLLKRVLLNMLKNALEATDKEGTVIIGFVPGEEGIIFFVRNDQYMKKAIQLQVFKRSFSTKGRDRGLGTYSIKLLGEKYLKGKVWFETDVVNGTTFYLKIPYSIKAAK